jgi:SagB-type dehydrogenase family enzyme
LPAPAPSLATTTDEHVAMAARELPGRVLTSPATRIWPPSRVTGDAWLAEHLLDRRRFRLQEPAVVALLSAFQIRATQELVRELSAALSFPEASAERTLKALHTRRLLITPEQRMDDARLRWFLTLKRQWGRFGWDEAAEYHAVTLDYPCFDYARQGFSADRERMRAYNAEEPDTNRVKRDYVGLDGLALPDPKADLPTGSSRDVWVHRPGHRPVGREELSAILALTFGATGLYPARPPTAPFLHRSSPSGGARHPSESYVAVLSVDGLRPGWYHVTMAPFSLRLLPAAPLEDAEARQLFPDGYERAPFTPLALIVITSMFERNMYRYREPRTFRTVHMDAGHLAATACLVARSLGVPAVASYADAAQAIEERLGLDGMVEGYMATVGIGQEPAP